MSKNSSYAPPGVYTLKAASEGADDLDGLEGYPEGTEDIDEGDITFDDAPPQMKPTIAVKAPKAPRAPRKPKVAAVVAPVAAPEAAPLVINNYVAAPKSKRTRKPKVAKAAPALKSKHRVNTVDSNKLEAYLDNLVNVEGYQLISVTGSSSIMGAFSVVSVKVG
jgi:hypothetical protein